MKVLVLSAEELVEAIPYSRSQVFKKMKAETGKSVNAFINLYRVKKARDLLIHTDWPISQVAFDVGFKDANYFSRKFKQEFEETPTQARKKKK